MVHGLPESNNCYIESAFLASSRGQTMWHAWMLKHVHANTRVTSIVATGSPDLYIFHRLRRGQDQAYLDYVHKNLHTV